MIPVRFINLEQTASNQVRYKCKPSSFSFSLLRSSASMWTTCLSMSCFITFWAIWNPSCALWVI